MTSGHWLIVIEGLTFAWMRSFEIIAGVQATITATPTAVFTVTSTPSVTVNSTVTEVYPTTLPPITVTQPAYTSQVTKTVTPPKVTVTSTKTNTKTSTQYSYGVTRTTKTKTAVCTTKTTKKDPPCTYFPTKTTLAYSIIATQAASAVPRVKDKRMTPGIMKRIRDERKRMAAARLEKEAPGKQLLRSSVAETNFLDVSTTTITQSTFTESVYTTETVPTVTEIITTTETSTQTV